MEFKLDLKIAGVHCVVTCERSALFRQIEKCLNGFKSSDSTNSHIAVSIRQTKFLKEGATDYIKNNIKQFSYSDSLLKIARLEGSCIFNSKTGTGDILVNCNGKMMINFIHFALMEIYKFILPAYDTIAIHSSSALYENRGIMFVGASGAGKSTAVRLLSSYYAVMHEDLTFVGHENRCCYIYNPPISSPFWNGLNYNTKAALKKIFFLKKSYCNKIYPISTQTALIKLIPNVYGFGIKHPESDKIFRICCKIINAVPSFILGFSKNLPLCLEKLS